MSWRPVWLTVPIDKPYRGPHRASQRCCHGDAPSLLTWAPSPASDDKFQGMAYEPVVTSDTRVSSHFAPSALPSSTALGAPRWEGNHRSCLAPSTTIVHHKPVLSFYPSHNNSFVTNKQQVFPLYLCLFLFLLPRVVQHRLLPPLAYRARFLLQLALFRPSPLLRLSSCACPFAVRFVSSCMGLRHFK